MPASGQAGAKQRLTPAGFRSLLIAAGAIFAWLLLGTIIYFLVDNCSTVSYCDGETVLTKNDCGWNLGESFYYSVQTGLSIGFGLLAETKDGSRLYSCIHILIGSSIVGGALAMFVGIMVDKGQVEAEGERAKLLRFTHDLHTKGGYMQVDRQELSQLIVKYPNHAKGVFELVETNDATLEEVMTNFKMATMNKRRKVADQYIIRVFEQREPPQDTWATAFREVIPTLRRYMSSIVIGQTTIVWSVWTVWVLVGIIFGLLVEKWDFITSLYFAISTLSTGGLCAVTRKTGNVVFVGFYALIGVPIYGAALGTFANILVTRYNAIQLANKLNANMDKSELDFVRLVASKDHKTNLDLAEFTELQLLRLGVVDSDLLEKIKAKFQKMDRDGSGLVSREEYMQAHGRKIKRTKVNA